MICYLIGALEELDLSNNPLEEIPVEVGNLQLLKELSEWEVGIGLLTSLQSLNISGIGLINWPPQLEKLINLEILNISHNAIELIPPRIADNIKLTLLDLSYNKIEIIPTELYNLPLQVCLYNAILLRIMSW
jgi:Leucine-rich repeat (LRR) protein